MKLLISHSTDIHNIFHVFAREVHAIWDWARTNGTGTGVDAEIGIVLIHYVDNPGNRWRRDLLKSTFRNVWIHRHSPPGAGFLSPAGTGPVARIERTHMFRYGHPPAWMVDPWTFRSYEPVPWLIESAAKARAGLARQSAAVPRAPGDPFKVVFVERRRSRVAYDADTRRPLSGVLNDLLSGCGVRFETVCFDDGVALAEQAGCLVDARIMIAVHGAANTNLFLLPAGAALFEINFRRHWHCDPVCPPHKSGRIPYTTRCDGPLRHHPSFHKADYHNLAQVFGVRYREFEVLDAERFLDDNPINLEKIYADAGQIAEAVAAELALERQAGNPRTPIAKNVVETRKLCHG